MREPAVVTYRGEVGRVGVAAGSEVGESVRGEILDELRAESDEGVMQRDGAQREPESASCVVGAHV